MCCRAIKTKVIEGAVIAFQSLSSLFLGLAMEKNNYSGPVVNQLINTALTVETKNVYLHGLMGPV